MSRRRRVWPWLAVCALAALLRLDLVARQGLWADEVFSLAIATGHSLEHPAADADPRLGDFVEPDGPVPAEELRRYLRHEDPPASAARVVRAVLLSDTNPPLYYLLLHGWTRLSGTGDRSLRIFSAVWSLACLPLIVRLGRRIGGNRAAFAAALLFALAPPALYYSTEGRMYSLLWFWALAAAWLSLELCRAGFRAGRFALWVSVSAAGLLTHYFFLFPWLALVAFLLARPGRLGRKGLAAGVALTVAAVAPWYARVPDSLDRWRVTRGWLEWPPVGFDRLGAARDLFLSFYSGAAGDLWGEHRLASALALGAFAGLASLMAVRLRLRAFGGRRLLPWLWLGAACAGPFVFDVLQGTYTCAVPRYALAGLPAAYLLAGSALACSSRRVGAAALALITLAWTPHITRIFRSEARSGSPIREVARSVALNAGPSDLVIVHSIPSGVLGVARYADDVEIGAWIGQLGKRRVPESLHVLADGRTRLLFVKLHEVGEPAPEEDWLRATALVFREASRGSAALVDFRPKDAPTF